MTTNSFFCFFFIQSYFPLLSVGWSCDFEPRVRPTWAAGSLTPHGIGINSNTSVSVNIGCIKNQGPEICLTLSS